eukprot:1159500-Pelagomonas_calceolata.AAC.31
MARKIAAKKEVCREPVVFPECYPGGPEEFPAYCMAKVQPLPMDVHCDIHDVVGALRPKLKWPSSLERDSRPKLEWLVSLELSCFTFLMTVLSGFGAQPGPIGPPRRSWAWSSGQRSSVKTAPSLDQAPGMPYVRTWAPRLGMAYPEDMRKKNPYNTQDAISCMSELLAAEAAAGGRDAIEASEDEDHNALCLQLLAAEAAAGGKDAIKASKDEDHNALCLQVFLFLGTVGCISELLAAEAAAGGRDAIEASEDEHHNARCLQDAISRVSELLAAEAAAGGRDVIRVSELLAAEAAAGGRDAIEAAEDEEEERQRKAGGGRA